MKITFITLLLVLPLLVSAQETPNPFLKKYAGTYYSGEDGKKFTTAEKRILTADGKYTCLYTDENKKPAKFTGTWNAEEGLLKLYRDGDNYAEGDPETYQMNESKVFHAGPYYLKKIVATKK